MCVWPFHRHGGETCCCFREPGKRQQPSTHHGFGSHSRLVRRVGQKRSLSGRRVSEREAQSDGEEAQVSRWRCGDLWHTHTHARCGKAQAVFGGRRRIRFYCDELNTLVPLCHAKSDKVTTLQWTTAYLKYIHRTHGETVREVRLFVESILYQANKIIVWPHSGLMKDCWPLSGLIVAGLNPFENGVCMFSLMSLRLF